MSYEVCNSQKCGEFNMLRCVCEKGHSGEHNYVVDFARDYPHNRVAKSKSEYKRRVAQGDHGVLPPIASAEGEKR